MAVPKRRTSHSKQGMRRSHHHAQAKAVQYCGRCSSPVLAHRVCWNCGWSNSQRREAVEVKGEGEE